MAYLPIAFSAAFLDGNADPISGATVTITIRNAAGTAVVTAGACTERTGEGGSYYEYILNPVADTTYTGVMSTAHASALQNWLLVGSATAEQTNPAGYTPAEIADEVWDVHTPRTLTSTTNMVMISFYNPQRQLWELIIGDSYTTGDDNGALDVTSDNFPVLTGGSILVTGRHRDYADDTFSIAGSVVSANTARLELTDTVTGVRLAGLYDVQWKATLADGTKRTLVKGVFEFSAPIIGGV